MASSPQGRVERAGLVLGLRRGQRPLRPARGVGRQRGRALQERGRRGQPAARLSAARRALELGRDVLIGPRRRLRAVPGAAIGIDLADRSRRPARDARPAGPRASAARYTAERTSG